MEILYDNSIFPQQVALILGFFDGIHAGHQDVIKNTPACKKVVVTFSSSPAIYFNKSFEYIYPRDYNFKLMEKCGVDYIYVQDFSKIVNLSAKEYIDFLIEKFNPISITTGFNHTFGANREGNSQYLSKNIHNIQIFNTQATKINDEIVSSTLIKKYLKLGEISKANSFLTRNFSIQSKVIEGAKLGRELGYPTANLKYPENIVKIPYGVYKVKVLDLPAIMNWGIKPTIGSDELIEIHIPNFNSNLYGKHLEFEIISKIRDEKKFNNLEELKNQIKKDVEKCLK